MKNKRLYLMIFIIICLAIAMCFAGCDDKNEDEPITPSKDVIKLIVFDENDSSHEENIEKGAQKSIAFSNEDFLFYGYYTEKNGQGFRVTDSKGNVLESFYSQAKETTYNAYPKIEEKQINITLLSSTGEQFQMYHPSQEEQVLPQANKKGYIFKGWNKREGEDYILGEDVINKIVPGTITKDTILYPKFQAKEFTINGNCGFVNVSYGENFELAYAEISGKVFLGYYSKEEGEGRIITDPTGKSINGFSFAEDEEEKESVTYYPYYKSSDICLVTIPNQGMLNDIFVTYKNYYQEGTPDKFVNYSKGETIKNLKPKRDGYFFDGWYKDASLLNRFDFDMTHTEEENLVLYPKWVALPSNGSQIKGILSDTTQGSILLSTNSEQQSYHAYYSDFTGTITILCNVFTSKGDSKGAQIFVGGNDEGEMLDGDRKTITVNVTKGEIVYFTGSPIKYEDEINFSYTITAGIPTQTSNVKADAPVAFNVLVERGKPYQFEVYTKEGYTFQGYYTEEDGQGTQVTDSTGKVEEWEFSEYKTIYAYYTQNP